MINDAKTITAESAIDEIGKRLKDRFWQDRAAAMVRELTGYGRSDVADLRVASRWPLAGTIRFTRAADGKRLKLYHTRHAFKGVEIK